jgi:hypothetical protein
MHMEEKASKKVVLRNQLGWGGYFCIEVEDVNDDQIGLR